MFMQPKQEANNDQVEISGGLPTVRQTILK